MSNIYDMIRARGAIKAFAQFSGGNDEGGVDRAYLVTADGDEIDLDVYEGEDEIGRNLENQIDGRYSFNGPGSISGVLEVDALTRTSKVTGYQDAPQEIDEEWS